MGKFAMETIVLVHSRHAIARLLPPLASLVLLLAGCADHGAQTRLDARTAFASVLANPVPASVENLQASGTANEGYVLHMRFTASERDINAILGAGYKRRTWNQIESRIMQAPANEFSPSWNPRAVVKKKCYELESADAWTRKGETSRHYLVIDEDARVVYFSGFGG